LKKKADILERSTAKKRMREEAKDDLDMVPVKQASKAPPKKFQL